MEISIISVGSSVNQIGEGLQYPVYGGKSSLVLRTEYKVLKRKNSKILERGYILQVTN